MFDTDDGSPEFALIEAIAAALRRELGDSMEDQPGGVPGESTAGQVNRAFRIVARCVIWTLRDPSEHPPDRLNRVLDRLARRRLAAAHLERPEIEHLIVHEAGGRDDWLAFLMLTSLDEIEEILRTRGPGRGAS